MRTFTRPGFSTVTITDEQIASVLAAPPTDCPYKRAHLNELSAAHYLAEKVWRSEAEEKAVALEITAAEYARRARRGLVADHIEKNAAAFAARPDTQSFAGQNMAAALYRQAAKARRAAGA